MVETKLPLFGIIFLVLALFFLVYLLIRILVTIAQKRKQGKRWVYTQSNVLNLSFFTLALTLLLFSWVSFWTGRSLRAFHKFDSRSQIGEIELVQETDITSRLVLTLFRSDGQSYTQNFFITGNKLQMEAEFLNFKPLLKTLGIPPCYKFVRINILDISDSGSVESEVTPVIFELLEGGTDFFFWTEKLDNLMPWVEAKVLKSDSTSVTEQVVKRIYITKDKKESPAIKKR